MHFNPILIYFSYSQVFKSFKPNSLGECACHFSVSKWWIGTHNTTMLPKLHHFFSTTCSAALLQCSVRLCNLQADGSCRPALSRRRGSRWVRPLTARSRACRTATAVARLRPQRTPAGRGFDRLLGGSGGFRRRPPVAGWANAGEGSVLCHRRRKKNLYLEHFILAGLGEFCYCNCLCQTMAAWAWTWSSFLYGDRWLQSYFGYISV
jgi:hypothetical protein